MSLVANKKMIESCTWMLIVGNFSGWKTSTEVLPYDTSGIPPGVVVCEMPQHR